jgi:hypothetical protein
VGRKDLAQEGREFCGERSAEREGRAPRGCPLDFPQDFGALFLDAVGDPYDRPDAAESSQPGQEAPRRFQGIGVREGRPGLRASIARANFNGKG